MEINMLNKLLVGLLLIFISGSVSCKKVEVEQPAERAAIDTGSVLDTGSGRTFWWVDRNGREEAVNAPTSRYYFPKISPDGTKIAFTARVEKYFGVWIMDLDNGTFRRMTFDQRTNNQPIWSPDGRKIAYSSGNSEGMPSSGNTSKIYLKPADGTGEAELAATLPVDLFFPLSWSPDGKIILMSDFGMSDGRINFDIGMLALDKSRSYRTLLEEDYNETQPQLSPDGRWMAYCTNESGTQQIYVRPFPNIDAGKWQISTEEGNSPRWSPNGKELFYIVGDTVAKAVMAVDIETRPTFRAGVPRVLFRGNYLGYKPNNGIPYDIHPDGKRFLMMKDSALGRGFNTLDENARQAMLAQIKERLQRLEAGSDQGAGLTRVDPVTLENNKQSDIVGLYYMGADVKEPVLLKKATPQYTERGRNARVEGIVVLEAVIRKNGTVDNFKVIRSLGYGLDEAAINTVAKKWQFKPATYQGENIDYPVQIEIKFQIYKKPGDEHQE